MDPASLIETLVTAGVLVVEDDNTLRRTASFRERVATRADAPHDDSVPFNDAVEDALDRHELLATYLAIADVAALKDADALRSVLLLARLNRADPPANGASKAFTPIDGDLLDLVLLLNERAIVYVWREDCPPCDVMREEFDDIFPEPPENIALFAVFGPDWALHLQEQYNVVGGPMTLFMLGTRVDVRLHGSQYRSAIENEVAKLAVA